MAGPTGACTNWRAHSRCHCGIGLKWLEIGGNATRSGDSLAAQRDIDRGMAPAMALRERFLDEYVPRHRRLSTTYAYRRSVDSSSSRKSAVAR